MLLGQNLSRPCNFSASPSLREAHSQPTSCLGLLQPITVGLAIGPVAIAAGSTSSRSRPPRRPCDMSTPPRARLPCQPCAAPRRPHQPRGPSPPPQPDSSSTWSQEWRTEGKFPQSETEPNPRRINIYWLQMT
jgi:hypothetical protein